MMDSDDLPAGWATCTLGDLIPNARPKVQADPASDLPFIGMDHIEADGFHLTGQARFADMKSAGSYFLAKDILYGRLRPYLNKVHRAKFEGVASAEFIVLPSTDHFDSDFIKFLLHRRQFVDFAISKSSGDRPRVKFDGIAGYEFALPPLPEQQRIVEKIETLFAELDKGEDALREVQKLLARYRQSVLKAAVTGTLTADWRAANGPPKATGQDLLARILKTRCETWQGRGKYKEPAEPDTQGLPELPEGWTWASVEQLSSSTPNALCIGPFGSNLRVDDYTDEGVPLIFVRHIRADDFTGQEPKFVSPEKARELSSHRVFPGDLLVTKMGDPPGDITVYPDDAPTAIITADCIRFALSETDISKAFIVRAVQSRLVQAQIAKISKGVAQQKVTLANFKKVAIPLPPSGEQTEIAELADLEFDRIQRASDMASVELCRGAALRQSILKDAFSGKLVPQDPSDEPAERLLGRIRAARTDKPKAKRKKATA